MRSTGGGELGGELMLVMVGLVGCVRQEREHAHVVSKEFLGSGCCPICSFRAKLNSRRGY